jgi:hypothetical protein
VAKKQIGAAVEPEQKVPPRFLLRADKPGHLRALIAAAAVLGPLVPEIERAVRDFELYEAGK